MKKVGVIDIGSNTIKLLVASGRDGQLIPIRVGIEECRISAGISHKRPSLQPEAMDRGVQAVQNLIGIARAEGVSQMKIVATSAVRDAANGSEFARLIRDRCDCEVDILTGQQEAETLAFALSFDPAVRGKNELHHFDLGGGSLEFNNIKQGHLQRAISMPLGAVRLTERFLADPHQPVTPEQRRQIESHVAETLLTEDIRPPHVDATLIFTGGSVAISQSLIFGRPLSHPEPARISLEQMETLYRQLAPLTFDERLRFQFMPRNRADVVCTAIIVLTNLMRHCKKDFFQHSLFALRHGLAAQTLGLRPPQEGFC